MAPTRKSRINKRYAGVTSYSPGKEVGNNSKSRQRGLASFSPDKDAGNSNKTNQRKKKLTDKLGPQWNKEELEQFYDGYRKFGKDWKKVAAAVRHRSAEMVEALYSMNRAYLSLPEGTASVIGLIAMMTDHYNVLEGSDSDQESNDALELPQRPTKRKRGKDQPNTTKEILQSHPIASTDGCLSFLKMRRDDGSQPRAVGKRTPRVPVQHYSHRKDYLETYISPLRKNRKSENVTEDEVAHVAALALTEASHRAGSPQVSTPYKRPEHIASSPAQSWDRFSVNPRSETTHARNHAASVDEDWLEGSVGSRGAENGDYAKDINSLIDMEGVGTVEVHRKGKKFYRKEKIEEDDGGEACSGTEEGINISNSKGKIDVEVSNTKTARSSPQSQRKRSKKLFFGDDSSDFDALQTLANLSVLMPPCTMESESSVQLKEEQKCDAEDKLGAPEATSTSHVRSRNKFSGSKQKVSHAKVEGTIKKSKLGRDANVEINTALTLEQPCSDPKTWKRKRKSSGSKISNAEAHVEYCTNEAVKTEFEEESKPVTKGKRTSQSITPSKQWKSSIRSSDGPTSGDFRRTGADLMVSAAKVNAACQNLPTKQKNKRKMYLPQAFYSDIKSAESTSKLQVNRHSSLTKLSSCLSSSLVRRWCTFEWFYNAIDYPWFAKKEFEEYLNHVGLGHIPRLTRVEWGVIRSSLGKPRRFSEHFLLEERDKLRQYRDSVRKHYTELRTGARDGLPTDLAKPLTVGQRVTAIHPKTRELHDGSVLTVDHDKCRIQFDRPEIGVEFVMDVDCMPLNPLENMPEALRRHTTSSGSFSFTSNEPQTNGNLNFGGPMMIVSSGNIEKVPIPMGTVGMHGKGDAIHAISQLKAAAIDIVNAHPTSYGQSYAVGNSQTREADIRAISELTRALDKKEALLMELRKTNDEIYDNQNNGDYSFRVSEPFKRHYATVLVQLKEASGQVSSALLDLRQRNTYPGNLLQWLKGPPAFSGLSGSFDGFSVPQDSGSSLVEIIKGSRLKAHAMVDAAIQAFSSSKEGEDAYAKIREALDSIDTKTLTSDSRVATTTNRPQEQVNGNQVTSTTAEPAVTGELNVPNVQTKTEKNEAQVPSEAIVSCVATLLMIQTCTERQYPPADVAQILDSAVTSLHPCCPQNLQIYREIQTYMGRIKTQILALVPT